MDTTAEPFREFLTNMAQGRPQGNKGRMYDPARDIAHLCGPLLALACDRLDEDPDALMARQSLGIADADLAAAVRAAVEFVHLELPERLTDDFEPEDFQRHLEASRLRQTNYVARMLLFAAVGELALIAGWQGKRAAVLYDQDGRPASQVDSGQEVAEAAGRLIGRLTSERTLPERIRRAGTAILREVTA